MRRDVCIFCSFRTLFESPIPFRRATRSFTNVRSRASQVAVAEARDEEEENVGRFRMKHAQQNGQPQQSSSSSRFMPSRKPQVNNGTRQIRIQPNEKSTQIRRIQSEPEEREHQRGQLPPWRSWKGFNPGQDEPPERLRREDPWPSEELLLPEQTYQQSPRLQSQGDGDWRPRSFSPLQSTPERIRSDHAQQRGNDFSQNSSRQTRDTRSQYVSKQSRPDLPRQAYTPMGRYSEETEDQQRHTRPQPTSIPIAPQLHNSYGGETRTKRDKPNRRNERFAMEDVPEVKRQQQARFKSADDDYDEPEPESRRQRKAKATKQHIQIPQFISVERLAQSLKVRLDVLIAELEEEGFEGARYDNILDSETSSMIAELHGFEVNVERTSLTKDLIARPAATDKSLLSPRPPIVTIMGHVDHGKTTILDWLRKTSVVESEHGGITQHIGAFSFMMPGSQKQITFLDTPGHAAFLEMRRRGANVTDIVVLVVAADDSVKPQTIEAIKHALDAKVPIIVAINKVDKGESNVERVKQDLSQHDITVEDWGGEYQAVPVSGKTGQGMKELEEAILLLAEVSDFRAESTGPTEGWVIESKVTSAGRVATILVKRGTLRPGDIIVAGSTWSRVRTLRTDSGGLVDEAGPGIPVQVDGWRGDPDAGMEVLQAENEDHAKQVVDLRKERIEASQAATDMAAITVSRNEEAEARALVLEEEAEKRRNFIATRHGKRRYVAAIDNEGWIERTESGPRKINFIIKADVAGSVEAIEAAVSSIGNHEIVANVIHSAPGQLTEFDITHLAATGETGYLITFNQPIDPNISALATSNGLQVLNHNIIYKVTDQVTSILTEALPPLISQKVLGEAEIGQVFEITMKRGKIKVAGCKVTNGIISRTNKVRVLRGGETVYTGTVDSLKNVKKDVSEMRKGSECGMGFDRWDEFEIGDQVQCYEEKEEKRSLY